jgi:hypothetical protein
LAPQNFEEAEIHLDRGQPSAGATDYAALINGLVQTFHKDIQVPTASVNSELQQITVVCTATISLH